MAKHCPHARFMQQIGQQIVVITATCCWCNISLEPEVPYGDKEFAAVSGHGPYTRVGAQRITHVDEDCPKRIDVSAVVPITGTMEEPQSPSGPVA